MDEVYFVDIYSGGYKWAGKGENECKIGRKTSFSLAYGRDGYEELSKDTCPENSTSVHVASKRGFMNNSALQYIPKIIFQRGVREYEKT
jgi:hypothetical protein